LSRDIWAALAGAIVERRGQAVQYIPGGDTLLPLVGGGQIAGKPMEKHPLATTAVVASVLFYLLTQDKKISPSEGLLFLIFYSLFISKAVVSFI